MACSLERLRASMKMSNFERKCSPGNRHMVFIGKTKSTSEKGLLLYIPNRIFLVRFGGISGEFGRAMVRILARRNKKKEEANLNKS